MRARLLSLVPLAALTVATLGLLGWQQRTASALRTGIAGLRAQGKERARLAAEHQRLVAAQPTAAEWDALLAERAAVAQLRTELTTMQQRATEAAAKRAPVTEPTQAAPSLKDNLLGFQLWKNAGQATPDAAFETVLWAAAGGDIDALVGLLALDPEARNEADALFARLPEAIRREFVTPERLVAVLAAKDVPLGSASIVGQYPSPTDTKVAAWLADAEGKYKTAIFSLRPEGGNWQLAVPAQVIRNYAAWLRTPLAAAKSPP